MVFMPKGFWKSNKVNMSSIYDSDNIETSFDTFWTGEKEKAIKQLSDEEDLNYNGLVSINSK